MLELGKYSMGIGDRFMHQGKAQLRAIIRARHAGVAITPVWNKSNREHSIVKSYPNDTLIAAMEAVRALGYTDRYFVDADHINLSNVDTFIENSNFFTLDVADYISKPPDDSALEEFARYTSRYLGNLSIPGIAQPFSITKELLMGIATKYLFATQQAFQIYQRIYQRKGNAQFVAEVSMDEVDQPQSPVELLFILCALGMLGLPPQTIAPKFSGRFNKGVDYEGDIKAFAREFEEYIHVIDFAVKEFKLPENLKLSVHSGSDKYAIYPVMREVFNRLDKGIHIKTAGTTWLEEVIGLALAGGEALELAKEIYSKSLVRFDELCAPYATVIDIKRNGLPTMDEVNSWDGTKFANTLRHVPGHPDYNPNIRQLIHVGYKVASEMDDRYTNLLKEHQDIVGLRVTENTYSRQICRLFDIVE